MPKLYSEEVKHQATILRKKGYSYKEIQQKIQIQVPKSTFRGWFRNIILTREAQKRIVKQMSLGGLKGSSIVWANNQIKKKLIIEETSQKLESEIKKIDYSSAKIILAMLYLGEGTKGNGQVRFANSDPKVIEIFLSFLRYVFVLDEKKFRGTVQCRADQDTLVLETFWSNLTRIPLSQFYKTRFDKRTIGKPTKRINYKGVFVLDYFSSQIFLELKLLSDIIHSRIKGL